MKIYVETPVKVEKGDWGYMDTQIYNVFHDSAYSMHTIGMIFSFSTLLPSSQTACAKMKFEGLTPHSSVGVQTNYDLFNLSE